jgi:hypothetical protein
MGYGHYNTLLSRQDQIGRNCVSCGGTNCIRTLAWLCRNTECGNAVIDLTTTELSPDDIQKLTKKVTTCPFCRHLGYLEEYVECDNCTPVGRNPVRATLFDVDMNVMRVENAARNDGKKSGTTLQVSQWTEARAIPERYAEMVKKVFPLDRIYCPTPLDQQAKMLKLPLPSVGGAPPAPVRAPMTVDEVARPYAPAAADPDEGAEEGGEGGMYMP